MADKVNETDSKKGFLIGCCQSIPRDGRIYTIEKYTIYKSNLLNAQGDDDGCGT